MDIANDAVHGRVTGGKTAVAARPRRLATPGIQSDDRPFKRPTMVALVLVLVAGMLLGALLMRLRYNAREVAVAVNGDTIDKNALFHRMEMVAGGGMMLKIVDEDLRLQFARKKGLEATEQEVQAQFDRLSKRSDFQQTLENNHQNIDDYKRGLLLNLSNIKVIGQGVKVPEDEIRKFYQENINPKNPLARYYTPEIVQLQAILTPTRAEADKAAQALAQGNTFSVVAQRYSRDSTSVNGGLLDPIIRGRSAMSKVPGFEDTAFKLKVGDQVGPINIRVPNQQDPTKLVDTWWIMKCVDKIAEHTEKFADVKDDCRYGVMWDKGLKLNGERVNAEFDAFKQKADIIAFWEQYSQVVKTKPAQLK